MDSIAALHELRQREYRAAGKVRMNKVPYLNLFTCALVLTSCSSVNKKEPHIVRALDAYGGFTSKTITVVSGNAQLKDSLPQGKKVIIWTDQLVDMGQDSQGLRIIVRGSAIANGHLANMVAVFKSQGTFENALERIAYLSKVGVDTWTGEALMPLKSQQPQGLFGGGVSAVTQIINLSLYGDTLSPGDGNIEIEIAPYEPSNQLLVKITRKIEITGEHNDSETLLSIPSEFQLTQYPGSKFDSGQRMHAGSTIILSFMTKDKPEFVYQYYKSEFANKGFKVEENDLLGKKILTGTNAIQGITIAAETNEDKVTAFNFTIKPVVAGVPVIPSTIQQQSITEPQNSTESQSSTQSTTSNNNG